MLNFETMEWLVIVSWVLAIIYVIRAELVWRRVRKKMYEFRIDTDSMVHDIRELERKCWKAD